MPGGRGFGPAGLRSGHWFFRSRWDTGRASCEGGIEGRVRGEGKPEASGRLGSVVFPILGRGWAPGLGIGVAGAILPAMPRVGRIVRSVGPWVLMGALVLAVLLKATIKPPAECVLIAALAVGVGFVVDRLATQFRTHMLGFWDRGS